MTASAVAITFHRIAAASTEYGKGVSPAADRYTLAAQRFREILDIIPARVCITVREFETVNPGKWVILTFDDGFLSDYAIVFHELLARGMKGTFLSLAKTLGGKVIRTLRCSGRCMQRRWRSVATA